MKEVEQNLPPAFRLKTGLRFSIFFSLINALLGIALYYSGLADFSGGTSGWIGLLLTGLSIYLASEYFKNRNSGLMSISDVMVISLWMGLFSGILTVILMLIQFQMDPEFLSRIQNSIEFQLEKNNLEGKKLEEMMEVMKVIISPGVLSVFSLIWSIIFYTIIGFILSFFLKRERETPF